MMLSRRGTPRLSQVLAGYGRGGDTMLAHINPAEAEMLKRRGGSGTTNPITGLREFFIDKGAFGGSGAIGSGGSMGGGGFSGGGSGRADKSRDGAGKKGSFGGAGLGSAVAAGGFSGVGSAPAGGKAGMAPSSGIGSINAAQGTFAKAEPGLNVGYGDVLGGLGGLVGGLFGGPLGGMGLGALGTAVGEGLGGFSIGGTSVTEARDRAYGGGGISNAGGASTRGADGPGRETTGTRSRGTRPGAPPAQGPATPPVAPTTPDWLRQIAGDNLSPIQLRSLIATQGSQGLDSAYRDMETLDFYRNLLKSSVKDYGEILPVEHRYLQDVYGFQYQPTLQDLYRILGG